MTYYAFRGEPVEDMHSDGKLSQNDMMVLNKYMVNRLAEILTAVHEGKWLQLELLYAYLQFNCTDWDRAEPDLEDLNIIWQEKQKMIIS